MSQRYSPSPEERRALESLAEEVAGVQQTLVANHPQLAQPDRGAHQPQLGSGRVLLHVPDSLPPELAGLGIVAPTGSTPRLGIGRISNGLGCPHAETDADFLGLMVAFKAPDGRRVDFITINDPGAPTDTPKEFIALLQATADAAVGGGPGLVNMLANQARLIGGLLRHAGHRAPAIATQVIRQTSRTQHSSTAYQQYWTGVVRARDVLGKCTFVPVTEANGPRPAGAGEHYLTDDWSRRQQGGPLEFRLYWVPLHRRIVDAAAGPDARMGRESSRARRTVSFQAFDPASMDTKLIALLASEMGANQGNWICRRRNTPRRGSSPTA